mmetsp:Transcript_1726/g.4037  ORF Transcript_1726/g.4037 Transcript_1726/m.4037 type:complete len:434 (+) Transcript_1726:764-2065(+)|eukprot:CAMPEP_0177598830 /NCGR_PEP_ID=MMETSP0419_2-20121207/12617_1 /TAXON_ID=582737 /ORGANISM="Tetraselmis sp., Strain GSL018" /LENGTH=433 /DNA_ID=CAMNT_0019091419 /DNA_START=315 /DNA_END=1616 /DNA_ORIENTATION=-
MEVDSQRWADLDKLLRRPGNVVGPGFEPGPEIRQFLQEHCRILVIGAGGLGCELLKDLALTGFVHIDVIDMDSIDISNLNRQFLFRTQDVGKPKAVVAAERVNARVAGANVTGHHARIEDFGSDFYASFHVIVLGLDSLEARRHMNTVICSLLEFDEDGSPDQSTIKPMVDGGTEGFKGHARVILPGVTPCFECTLWLFPPQVKFPLCTLAETPRSAAHCIEYAHLIQWENERAGEAFNADCEEHMRWVFDKALERANHHGISGVTYQYAQGVVKNIIPAIASTNAIVSAACVIEVLKIVSMCSTGMNNYMMYVGSGGVYTHTVAYERDPDCPICSPGLPLYVRPAMTLQETIDAMLKDEAIGSRVSAPSVSHGADNLYMRGALEAMTRENLSKPLAELLGSKSCVVSVNDKSLPAPMRVRLCMQDEVMDGAV